MLIIYADGALLHHSYLNDRYNSVYDKHLKTEVNKAGSFEFTISSAHKLYDSLERFKTKIQLWMNDTLLFDGRVLEINETITKERKVYCEGNLAYLLDSLSAPYTGTMAVGDYLRKRIQEHNAQVEADKQFTVRNIDPELAGKNVDVDESGYQDTRADIEANILNIHRGFLRTENQNGVLYLDYLKEDTEIGNQPMMFGFNLSDYTKNTPSTDVYSIMLPIGDDGLTIETVNNGSKYIENQTLINKFGRVYHSQQFSGITSAAELLSEATTYFNLIADVMLTPTFSIKLADVSNWVVSYTPPIVGKKYKLSGPDGDLYIYQAYSIDYDFDEIGNTTIEFTSPDTTYASTHRRGSSVGKSNGGSGTNKRSGSGGNASGINLKYYHEGNDSAKIIASDIGLESSSTHIAVKDKLSIIASESDYADFIENGGVGSILEVDPKGFRSISGVLKSAFGKFKGADGTAILQNMEAITQFAGNFTVDSEGIVRLKDGASFMIKKDGIYSLVGTENDMASAISQTKSEIRSEVYAANSSLYSYIQQTASSITSRVEDTEAGLYSAIQQSASGIRQTIVSTTNRTWVQDNDPRSQAGGEHTPKVGDIWIESTHQGTWDGAEGYDWEHDEGYDWSQIMGARIWTWQNDKWELASDKQQVISYTDLVNTADTLISQKIAGIVNDEGLLDVYMSKLEQTATTIRSEVHAATSDTYSYIQQTTSSIILSIDSHIQKTYVSDSVKEGPPEIIIGEDGIARDANGRALLDGDTWIDTADQDTWDKALEWNWNDDAVYNWNDLRDDEIQRYDAATKTWVHVVNGRVFTDPLDFEIADDRITANMRSIDVVNEKVEENAHQFFVTTQELRSTFNDRITDVGSQLVQTKNELRSDFYAANSQIYSYVLQSASSLTSHFENEIDNVGSSITQTASEIRSEVHAANSTVWSHIKQNADSIELKVSKNGIVSAINQTAESIKISASKINLDGYVTASTFEAEQARLTNIVSGNTSVSKIVGVTANFSNLIVTNSISYGPHNVDLTSAIASFGNASESGGKITIPTTTINGRAGSSITFNIADTKYYKDAIASAKEIKSVSVNLTGTPTISMGAYTQSGTATVTRGDGTTAQKSITTDVTAAYNLGWSNGYSAGSSTGGTYTPKSYTHYGALYEYSSVDGYSRVGSGYWFLSSKKTMYEKES